MNKVYMFFCISISMIIVLGKLFYSGNYSSLGSIFEPINVNIEAKDCSKYFLSVDSSNIDLLYAYKSDPIAFYQYSKLQDSICNMSRNVIEVGVKNLFLRADSKNALDEIKAINVTIGSRNFNLQKENIITTQNAESYFIDLSYFKLNQKSEFINSNNANFLFDVFIMLISPPYLLIWILVFLFLVPIDSTKVKNVLSQNYLSILFFIVIFGFILRLHNFTSVSLWGDELYSVGVVGYPYSSMLSVFSDPGNPPFYNLLLKIWLKIFGYNIESARLLSVIIGSIAPISIFIFLKNHIKTDNLSIAILGALFMAFSQVAVGASHEVRGYVLELTLLPLVCNFLFNFYKNRDIKNLIFYILFSMMLCNTHYYGSIFIFSIFVISIFVLRDIKSILILFVANIFIALSLLPYFYITAFNKTLMDSSFNTWIKMPNINEIALLPLQLVGGGIALFIFFVFVLYCLKQKDRILYFTLSICVLMVIIPYLASYIRPIFTTKYVIFTIYPFFIIFISLTIFTLKVQHRFLFIPLCIYIFSIPLFDKNVSILGRGDNSRAKLEFITQDSMRYKNAYIVDTNKIMASKDRQYEIYNLQPNAKFIKDISNLDSGVFYFDNYFTKHDDIVARLEENGALVCKIPFGRNNSNKLHEKNEYIYKVIIK